MIARQNFRQLFSFVLDYTRTGSRIPFPSLCHYSVLFFFLFLLLVTRATPTGSDYPGYVILSFSIMLIVLWKLMPNVSCLYNNFTEMYINFTFARTRVQRKIKQILLRNNNTKVGIIFILKNRRTNRTVHVQRTDSMIMLPFYMYTPLLSFSPLYVLVPEFFLSDWQNY